MDVQVVYFGVGGGDYFVFQLCWNLDCLLWWGEEVVFGGMYVEYVVDGVGKLYLGVLVV